LVVCRDSKLLLRHVSKFGSCSSVADT
jgi:hypothetical protein